MDNVRRLLEFTVALLALIVLSPVVVLVATVIRITDGRPVFFRQMRSGIAGRPFSIVKFRTMREPTAEEQRFETDEQRMTRIGRLLRKTSLDELPELWNVVRGQMGIIGPRPLPTQYLAQYTLDERRRLDIRPGITGLAVVVGRHTLEFEHRLALDVWYVDNRNLRLDLRIIALTIRQLLRPDHVAVAQDLDGIAFPTRFRDSLHTDASPGSPDER